MGNSVDCCNRPPSPLSNEVEENKDLLTVNSHVASQSSSSQKTVQVQPQPIGKRRSGSGDSLKTEETGNSFRDMEEESLRDKCMLSAGDGDATCCKSAEKDEKLDSLKGGKQCSEVTARQEGRANWNPPMLAATSCAPWPEYLTPETSPKVTASAGIARRGRETQSHSDGSLLKESDVSSGKDRVSFRKSDENYEVFHSLKEEKQQSKLTSHQEYRSSSHQSVVAAVPCLVQPTCLTSDTFPKDTARAGLTKDPWEAQSNPDERTINRIPATAEVKLAMGNGEASKFQNRISESEKRPLIPEPEGSGEQCHDTMSSVNNCKKARLTTVSSDGHTGFHQEADVVKQEHESEPEAKVCQEATKQAQVQEDKRPDDQEANGASVENITWKHTADPCMETGDSTVSQEEDTLHSFEESSVSPKELDDTNMRDTGKDSDEDLYRDEDEIEKEKMGVMLNNEFSDIEEMVSVSPEVDILEYCRKEWKGNTAKANQMRKGYNAVSQVFSSIRRVRGDNYCALRAVLFQALSQTTELPAWLQNEGLVQIPEKLTAKYEWANQWRFRQDLKKENKSPVEKMKEHLQLLKERWTYLCAIEDPNKKLAACEEIFRSEQEEYSLYEATKLLMLNKAAELYEEKEEGKEVPIFCWLLFARDGSDNPYHFMKNHLNQVGYTGGLEQVEMFLLGYALRLSIKVYRLSNHGTEEFVTFYPDDHKEWPMVILTAEDDRHYNVLVGRKERTRDKEETSVAELTKPS